MVCFVLCLVSFWSVSYCRQLVLVIRPRTVVEDGVQLNPLAHAPLGPDAAVPLTMDRTCHHGVLNRLDWRDDATMPSRGSVHAEDLRLLPLDNDVFGHAASVRRRRLTLGERAAGLATDS